MRGFVLLLVGACVGVFSAGQTVGAAFAKGCATNPDIFIFVKPAAEFLHQQELSCLDTGWDPYDVDKNEEHAKRKFAVVTAHIVNAISDFRRTVSLLATSVCAVHATFIT